MAANVVHVMQRNEGSALMILEDDYGVQLLVHGLIKDNKKDKNVTVDCYMSGNKTSFDLADFLANRVEITGSGAKTKNK